MRVATDRRALKEPGGTDPAQVFVIDAVQDGGAGGDLVFVRIGHRITLRLLLCRPLVLWWRVCAISHWRGGCNIHLRPLLYELLRCVLFLYLVDYLFGLLSLAAWEGDLLLVDGDG